MIFWKVSLRHLWTFDVSSSIGIIKSGYHFQTVPISTRYANTRKNSMKVPEFLYPLCAFRGKTEAERPSERKRNSVTDFCLVRTSPVTDVWHRIEWKTNDETCEETDGKGIKNTYSRRIWGSHVPDRSYVVTSNHEILVGDVKKNKNKNSYSGIELVEREGETLFQNPPLHLRDSFHLCYSHGKWYRGVLITPTLLPPPSPLGSTSSTARRVLFGPPTSRSSHYYCTISALRSPSWSQSTLPSSDLFRLSRIFIFFKRPCIDFIERNSSHLGSERIHRVHPHFWQNEEHRNGNKNS